MQSRYKGRSSSGHQGVTSPGMLALIAAALEYLDPSCDYDRWFRIGAAIHTATHGNDDGFALFDEWSSLSHKYPGRRSLENRWKGYDRPVERPITVATLIRFATQEGGVSLRHLQEKAGMWS